MDIEQEEDELVKRWTVRKWSKALAVAVERAERAEAERDRMTNAYRATNTAYRDKAREHENELARAKRAESHLQIAEVERDDLGIELDLLTNLWDQVVLNRAERAEADQIAVEALREVGWRLRDWVDSDEHNGPRIAAKLYRAEEITREALDRIKEAGK